MPPPQRLIKKQLADAEGTQREQLDELKRQQAEEIVAKQAKWREELNDLCTVQANEIQDFELRITRAAANEEAELPRELHKYRYKVSFKLKKMRSLLAELPRVPASEREPS